jgi:hypothetical protein
VVEKLYDDQGRFTGIGRRTLRLAPADPSAHRGFHVGRVDGDNRPFLLDGATYDKLAADLFDP